MKTLMTLWQFILTHQLASYYVLAVLIDQLPAPYAESGGFYRYFFGVTQVLAANVVRGKRGVQGTLAGK